MNSTDLPIRLAASALAAALALAAPTFAAAEADEADAADTDHGLVLELSAWSATPRNLDLDYAFVGGGSLSGGGSVRTLDSERSTDPVFYAGWRLGSSPGTELGMSFWEYEGSSTAATGTFPLDVGALLGSPDFTFTLVDSASAASRLRATRVDARARFSHELGLTGRIEFEAGLRMFRFEETTNVAYALEFGQLIEEFINGGTDTSGIGPRIGAGYTRRFGRIRAGGALGIAAPVGEVESRTLDELLVDGESQIANLVDREGTRRVFVHFEASLRLEADLGAGWTGTLGYVFEQWSGVRTRLRFVDEVAQNTTVPDDDDAVFEGLTVGVRYEF